MVPTWRLTLPEVTFLYPSSRFKSICCFTFVFLFFDDFSYIFLFFCLHRSSLFYDTCFKHLFSTLPTIHLIFRSMWHHSDSAVSFFFLLVSAISPQLSFYSISIYSFFYPFRFAFLSLFRSLQEKKIFEKIEDLDINVWRRWHLAVYPT